MIKTNQLQSGSKCRYYFMTDPERKRKKNNLTCLKFLRFKWQIDLADLLFQLGKPTISWFLIIKEKQAPNTVKIPVLEAVTWWFCILRSCVYHVLSHNHRAAAIHVLTSLCASCRSLTSRSVTPYRQFNVARATSGQRHVSLFIDTCALV